LKPLASPLTAAAMLDETGSEKSKNAFYCAPALTSMKLEFCTVTSICAYLTVYGLNLCRFLDEEAASFDFV
jgi:hypothetical protein